MYIESFCPTLITLSRYLEEAALSTSISSSVFIFLWLFSMFFELQLSTAQARRQKKLQHLTRPVEIVMLTTKGLQERKTQLLKGTTVEKQVIKIN